MPNRILEYIQRGLIAALSVVLALVAWTIFHGVLETPAGNASEGQTAAVATTSPTATTLPPDDGEPGLPGDAATSTTTSVAPAFVPPWGEGSCAESAPEVGEDESVLKVFYNCGTGGPSGETFVYRRVPATNRVLTNTFRQLVRGPNDSEREKGFGSFFTDTVTIEAVSLREGRAIIDFGGLESIADSLATEEAVEYFLANLGANAFQFSSVQAVEYRSNGVCSDFWELMGGSGCDVISRTQWLASVEPYR